MPSCKMLTLCLIRHAKSSWDTPGLRDFDRPLNERGRREAPQMARLLAGTGLKPELIVSSPAKRALTTALTFADTFGIAEGEVQRESNIYEADVEDIMEVVHDLPGTVQTVLLFGHNPTLTDVANRFSKQLIENVPTCGIIRIESSADFWSELSRSNAEVKAAYFPKELL